VIPNVVYTFPEIASVERARRAEGGGIAYAVGKFPFTANGRAKVNHQTDGFVKILADAKTDRVLGVHIVGADAGNMIAEAAVAMEFGAASEDIARPCHAPPTTLTEAVKKRRSPSTSRDQHVIAQPLPSGSASVSIREASAWSTWPLQPLRRSDVKRRGCSRSRLNGIWGAAAGYRARPSSG